MGFLFCLASVRWVFCMQPFEKKNVSGDWDCKRSASQPLCHQVRADVPFQDIYHNFTEADP